MRRNHDLSAFAQIHPDTPVTSEGLTKLEYATIHLAAGMHADPVNTDSHEEIALQAHLQALAIFTVIEHSS